MTEGLRSLCWEGESHAQSFPPQSSAHPRGPAHPKAPPTHVASHSHMTLASSEPGPSSL